MEVGGVQWLAMLLLLLIAEEIVRLGDARGEGEKLSFSGVCATGTGEKVTMEREELKRVTTSSCRDGAECYGDFLVRRDGDRDITSPGKKHHHTGKETPQTSLLAALH